MSGGGYEGAEEEEEEESLKADEYEAGRRVYIPSYLSCAEAVRSKASRRAT